MDKLTPLGEGTGSEGGTESSGRVEENGLYWTKFFFLQYFLSF
jgi:hypothetical protein